MRVRWTRVKRPSCSFFVPTNKTKIRKGKGKKENEKRKKGNVYFQKKWQQRKRERKQSKKNPGECGERRKVTVMYQFWGEKIDSPGSLYSTSESAKVVESQSRKRGFKEREEGERG